MIISNNTETFVHFYPFFRSVISGSLVISLNPESRIEFFNFNQFS